RGVVPANWLVVMLADRGLWARWLFQEIQLLGWHPLMRINGGGRFRPDGSMRFVSLKQMVPRVGMSWSGQGTAFSTPGRQLTGTLLGWWGSGHKEPWRIRTDLAPQQGDASWYGLRMSVAVKNGSAFAVGMDPPEGLRNETGLVVASGVGAG